MSMGLPSAKFSSDQPIQRLGVTSRQFKVAPSIAEQAIFIPKPHDRVDFKLKVNAGGDAGQPMPTLGQGNTRETVQLLGSGNKSAQATDQAAGLPTGQNIASGQLGTNGLTARFDQAAWKGQPGGYVTMEINNNPTKQTGSSDPIPTQEEGRQVNNRQINFTQQYDSYGRPRIGFSREPYDFAATKYVSVTNQIAFQANMAEMHSEYDKYLLTGKGSPDNGQPPPQAGADVTGQDKTAGNSVDNVVGGAKAAENSQPAAIGQGAPGVGVNEIPIFGSTSDKPSVKTTGNEGGADDAKKAGVAGQVGATYGNSAGQDAKSGSLKVAV